MNLKNIFIKYNNKRVILIIVILFFLLCNINRENKVLIINRIPMMENLEKNKIGVYIDGEVNKRGYIIMKEGATLEQAINMAGGITKQADIQKIDLKKILKNQEKIIIPMVRKEYVEEISIEKDKGKVNINCASKEELIMLDGIGEKTAENIVNYRENNNFDTIEEIMEVNGIGEGKFNKIKEKIYV